jgi:hypothetical protein
MVKLNKEDFKNTKQAFFVYEVYTVNFSKPASICTKNMAGLEGGQFCETSFVKNCYAGT